MPRTSRAADIRTEYVHWLEQQLKDENSRGTATFWGLANLMFDTEFTWTHPMDENRVVDGMDLRAEFSHIAPVGRANMLALGPVSFLEVLIGLSRKMAFVAGESAPGWAYVLLQNLGLEKAYDPLSRRKQNQAQTTMATVMSRSYNPDGTGGFFPLSWPDGDQTQVELWYQLNAYIAELHPEH